MTNIVTDSDGNVYKTMAENIALSDEVRQSTLEEAKGINFEKGWRPYCHMCSSFARMKQYNYGFKCNVCGNMKGP